MRAIDRSACLSDGHFGFEYDDPERLATLVEVLRARQVGLIYTVHDLRNPNHATPEQQDAGLDILIPAADRLITLTPWAADQIQRRWNRHATVLPHPHVAELSQLGTAPSQPVGPHRVGIHFKSLRANMVTTALLAAAADVVRARGDMVLEVHLHCDVVSPRGRNHDPELIALVCDLSDEGVAQLQVHPYLDHDELVAVIARCDSWVLPYRFGTHSGLLELCRDLGAAIVAPACGGYGDQGAQHLFTSDETDGFDADSFRRALQHTVDDGPVAALSTSQRDRQRHHVARAHRDLYIQVRSRVADKDSGLSR